VDGVYLFIGLRVAASGRCCGYNTVLLAGKCVDPPNESQFLKRVCYFWSHLCVIQECLLHRASDCVLWNFSVSDPEHSQ